MKPRTQTQPGMRFGRWVVTDYEFRSGARKWTPVRCDCGTERRVDTGSLVRGDSKSCGCLMRELLAAKKTTHGLHGSPLYSTWAGARRRCINPKDAKYPDYGGRGITMHPEWVEGFPPFHDYIMSTLGPKPTPSHSLDRIDNDKGYEPGNLRWATKTEQTRNRRKMARLRDLVAA